MAATTPGSGVLELRGVCKRYGIGQGGQVTALCPAAVATAALAQPRLPVCLPRPGQFSDQSAQVVTGDPDEGRMTQGRTSP